MQNQRIISRAIIKVEEKERNRLGAELHDNVNQLLVSARLYIGLEKKKQNGDCEFLDKADEHLSLAIQEIRELTRSLTTSVVINEGLQKCIEEIARTMMELASIRLQINISDHAIDNLSAEQQLMIYRIIQEQTSNILKYAAADEASISLRLVNNDAELVIGDNGKGFDKTEKKMNGIGFINMLNRVEAFGGQMKVFTSPDNGCKLVITFPLNET